jgi:hypothetical protein
VAGKVKGAEARLCGPCRYHRGIVFYSGGREANLKACEARKRGCGLCFGKVVVAAMWMMVGA